jgi:SynChlorMet cassette radical SAM/SPASM protein ScmF
MDSDSPILKKYPLRQIYFYLTEGCNLRCRHCWIAPKYQGMGQVYDALPPPLFERILNEAKPLGLQAVKLTGGEPLLHPDIEQLLRIVANSRLKLIMETNGALCTPALAQAAAACQSPFVSVSLDAVEARTHEWVRGVKGCFEATMEGIRNLVGAGLKPQIIMSLMKRNQDQMADMVNLAEQVGAGSVRFNLIQPTERGSTLHTAGETLSVSKLIELGQWVNETLAKRTQLPVLYNQPIAFKPMSRMFGHNGGGCETCGIKGIIGVLADGSYALCGIGTSVPEMVFGRAGDDDLRTVWETNEMLNRIRMDLPERLEGICGQCV